MESVGRRNVDNRAGGMVQGDFSTWVWMEEPVFHKKMWREIFGGGLRRFMRALRGGREERLLFSDAEKENAFPLPRPLTPAKDRERRTEKCRRMQEAVGLFTVSWRERTADPL